MLLHKYLSNRIWWCNLFYEECNYILRINRGDDFLFTLYLNKGNEVYPQRYVLQENDKIYLGVMQPNQLFENAILKKVFTVNDLNEEGDIVIKLSSEDTFRLLEGKYYYEIKACFYNNNNPIIKTVVSRNQLFIQGW